MELKYTEPPVNEAGTAVSGCGTIHISEIKPTLTQLTTELGFNVDLNDYTLGSTGKKEYSGDIDLVLDELMWHAGAGELRISLTNLYGSDNVARNGNMVHLKYPIVSYKEELQGSTPRTGYVQIDFNLGDADWERFYHFSPGDKSEYKGAHRNLAIAAISSVNVIMESMGTDSQGRPRSTYRWKFGSNGFIKVHRVSVKDPRSGDWMKKQVDHDLGQTLRDPTLIAHTLFLTEDATADDLFSLETIMAAVKRYGGMVEQEQIWRRMAHNFTDWKDGKNFTYPPEIAKYIPLDDK